MTTDDNLGDQIGQINIRHTCQQLCGRQNPKWAILNFITMCHKIDVKE